MRSIIDRISSSVARRLDRDYQTLKRLSSQKRYTPGHAQLAGRHFEFPDARSFAFTYREVFLKRIYDFMPTAPKPFIIDCGANIGLSVIFFKEICPDAEILAFEPERRIFGFLRDNLEKNGIIDVEMVQKALWKEQTSLTFINEGSDANRIQQVFEDEGRSETYTVDTATLSSYVDREVDFLKIDIEGAEVAVMREVEPKLHLVRRIFIEYHSSRSGRQELSSIIDILERNGFHYYIDAPNPSKARPYIDESVDEFASFDFFLNIYAIR